MDTSMILLVLFIVIAGMVVVGAAYYIFKAHQIIRHDESTADLLADVQRDIQKGH